MKHRERFGYMFLGAVIMLVGLGLGAILSPPMVAQQRNGVFDNIECNTLSILGKNGQTAFFFGTIPSGNVCLVYKPSGKEAMNLWSSAFGNGITIFDDSEKSALSLRNFKGLENKIAIHDGSGKDAIELKSNILKGNNNVTIYDTAGEVIWEAP